MVILAFSNRHGAEKAELLKYVASKEPFYSSHVNFDASVDINSLEHKFGE